MKYINRKNSFLIKVKIIKMIRKFRSKKKIHRRRSNSSSNLRNHNRISTLRRVNSKKIIQLAKLRKTMNSMEKCLPKQTTPALDSTAKL